MTPGASDVYNTLDENELMIIYNISIICIVHYTIL